MKTSDGGHTTNYADTLITVAPGTRAVAGSPPPPARAAWPSVSSRCSMGMTTN
ncbi:hypothetical protein ACWKWA_05605 [Dermacoccus abyssi]